MRLKRVSGKTIQMRLTLRAQVSLETRSLVSCPVPCATACDRANVHFSNEILSVDLCTNFWHLFVWTALAVAQLNIIDRSEWYVVRFWRRRKKEWEMHFHIVCCILHTIGTRMTLTDLCCVDDDDDAIFACHRSVYLRACDACVHYGNGEKKND